MDTSRLRRLWAAGTTAALCAGLAGTAQAQTPCTFTLGFAELHAQLGPARVGSCREVQQSSPNGDAHQATTEGLLVWRKADNWTAFTDGHSTWINGPNGIEQRRNSERFRWEPDAGAAGTSVVGAVLADPPPLRPGTQLGLPVAGPTLRLTPLAFERVAATGIGQPLLKVSVKLEGGTNGQGLGKYAYWDFRLRNADGVEYRPSALAAARPGAIGDGTLGRDQWVVGDLYFEAPAVGVGYGLHYYPSGLADLRVAISRWLGGAA